MRARSPAFAFLATLLALAATPALADTTFRANLTGGAEVPPVTSTNASGTGTVVLNTAENQITVTLSWSGLSAPQTMAHIHGAAPVTAEAGILIDLGTTGGTSGSIGTRTFVVTPQQVANLKAGLTYFNVHTSTNPGGEIRGQIIQDGATLFVAGLDGQQEVPPNSSNGIGLGQVVLDPAGTGISVSLLFSNLGSPQTMSHIHGPAPPGTNAGILYDIGSTGQTSGAFLDRRFSVTPQQAADLRANLWYFNVHSQSIMAGEIRGQIYKVGAGLRIGPEHTGTWFDPAQSGHGLFVEVLPGNKIVAAWFTYGPNGGQAWFMGSGDIQDGFAIIDMVLPNGARFIPNFDPNDVQRTPWGNITLTFEDCNNGRVDFRSVLGFGTGSMRLVRLTLPAGLSCP